jgi:hypothetical protein
MQGLQRVHVSSTQTRMLRAVDNSSDQVSNQHSQSHRYNPIGRFSSYRGIRLLWISSACATPATLVDLDTACADALCDYLVAIHDVRGDDAGLYVRRIRELVAAGECIMGLGTPILDILCSLRGCSRRSSSGV